MEKKADGLFRRKKNNAKDERVTPKM